MKIAVKNDRRTFLKTSILASGGLLIGYALKGKDLPEISMHTGENVMNALLHIGEDNSVHIILSKVEMGQGIWTTLSMLIAEELDCDWNKIKVRHSPPGKGDDFKQHLFVTSTGGSDTTRSEFDRYRMAGATARVMLISVAAKKLGVPADMCKTENGFVVAGNRRISYGEVAREASNLTVPVVKLRESGAWKLIGKSQKRLDNTEKINGKAIYGIDIQVPGLLTAVVAHAPVFGGKVKNFDDSLAKLVLGVRDVVQIPTGIAVLADHFWAAKLGRDALKIEWNDGENKSVDSKQLQEEYVQLSGTKGKVIREKGHVATAFQKAADTMDLAFSFPYLAHAPMEPLNCTVKIHKDKCDLWTGTQSPLLHQAEIAAFLGLPPVDVALNTPHLGGSFGRRGSFSGDWIMEAVQIAKVSGKFIKLVWSREDDIRGGYYRPVYVHKVRIGIGGNGLPMAWEHRIVGQSLFTNTPLEKDIVADGIDYSLVTTASPYSDSIPDFSFELHMTKVGVPVLPWRSVGNTHTAFVVESTINELAHRAGKDAVEYRRVLFENHPRHLSVLNMAAEKSGWFVKAPAGHFRGIAIHEAMGSCVCQVVELSVKNKSIQLHRVVCVIDCGLAVNPDGVRAQMESGIIYGLTAALYGEITIEKGQVKQSNFHDYQILHMDESPEIEVHIVESNSKMGGAGEPGVPPIAPALAHTLFAATGNRIRSLPIRKEELF